MKLYWGSGSPVSWRAQIALALKGLPYESHRLDLGQREHRGDAFLAINPRGTFPVLVDGDVTVRDSLAILAYLDRAYPAPALFGADAAQAAGIWQRVCEHDSGLGLHANTITQAFFRKGGLDEPEPVRVAIARAREELAAMNAGLEYESWLQGASVSAAEVVFYPTMHRILRAASKPEAAAFELSTDMLDTTFPAVAGWLARFAALPGIDATYPPHWR